ncbi:MAG: excinuclease ABC subunit UvrB [Sulfurospirillaceae bacterium]|nr:excinuclease ABC subunit UvrB [Sulfurospirillaceae bacterium]MDD3463250.1 excinuclease ABC subunit UvrB [Sulfurospirillaceae bacterium]
MTEFELKSSFLPAGDQPQAIEKLTASIYSGNRYQTLIGVTGSGKTYTMAHIIQKLKMPTLIMTHNKTLAAQLYSEFRGFFPNNHVEYFISYYDYYQPEAYIPRSDLYIDKDSSINEELERLRLSATASLLSYDDVICVASVSANYGLGNPHEYKKMVQALEIKQSINQKTLLLRLVDMGYKRNDAYFDRGDFRVNGDVIDIYPAYSEEEAVRIEFFGDEIESIYYFEALTNKKLQNLEKIVIYAANQFIVGKERLEQAIKQIEEELEQRLAFFQTENKIVEYQRLKQRVEFDLEMLKSTGACKGVENYAKYLTGIKTGDTPYSLFDYFEAMGKEYLVIVDESHVSLPQFRGMYAGDRSRKEVLVEYGFRLPSALENRPLMFDEFINKAPRYLFVSATPKELELNLSKENVAQQIIRPTGLLDPKVEILSSKYQVETLFDEIKKTIAQNERVLVTTLTKKMSEELSRYYGELGIKVKYMHSDIDAIERNQIIRALRMGDFDVLIGINLLREGLDLPEVSLIAILDADKEGFLRSETSLIQTMGRAARNTNGRVIMFAQKITESMKKAIETTEKRRLVQEAFNIQHGITPQNTTRTLDENLKVEDMGELYRSSDKKDKIPPSEKRKIVLQMTKQMHEAAKQLEFEKAAKIRDEIARLKKL